MTTAMRVSTTTSKSSAKIMSLSSLSTLSSSSSSTTTSTTTTSVTTTTTTTISTKASSMSLSWYIPSSLFRRSSFADASSPIDFGYVVIVRVVSLFAVGAVVAVAVTVAASVSVALVMGVAAQKGAEGTTLWSSGVSLSSSLFSMFLSLLSSSSSSSSSLRFFVSAAAASPSSSSSSLPLPFPPFSSPALCNRGGQAAAEGATEGAARQKRRRLVLAVDGGTESIRARLFDAESGQAAGRSVASPYRTRHPQPGWAEQDPDEWWERMGEAVRGALDSLENDDNDDNDNDNDDIDNDNVDEAATSAGPQKHRHKPSRDDVCAMCVDTTCCSVVLLNAQYEPIRPCLLWMDARSSRETRDILQQCRGDPALVVNCNGHGPLSAEWMTPKALWLKRNEKENWDLARVVCEYQDYINYKLTGCLVASSCNAASRWHWDGEECIASDDDDGTHDDNLGKGNDAEADADNRRYPGRPMSMYRTLGLADLADKLPRKCLPMGMPIGSGLTSEAARHLGGLRPGLPVAQGGPDAFVAMVGLGCVNPGQVCLVTGSSHLHCVVASDNNDVFDAVNDANDIDNNDDDTKGGNKSTIKRRKGRAGAWGPYRGAPLPGLCFSEGGQSSTGSVARWFKSLLCLLPIEGDKAANGTGDENDNIGPSYAQLDEEASRIPPGSHGVVALSTFQGSRTPVTDPTARGAIVGLTLSHTRAHLWRAILESVCLGTRACIDSLVGNNIRGESADADADAVEVVVAGGATRSELWLQMHADVTGRTLVLRECSSDAPLLGCAILASVCAGVHGTVHDAVRSMVRTERTVTPDKDARDTYDALYRNIYTKLDERGREISSLIASLRGGGGGEKEKGGGSGGVVAAAAADNERKKASKYGAERVISSATSFVRRRFVTIAATTAIPRGGAAGEGIGERAGTGGKNMAVRSSDDATTDANEKKMDGTSDTTATALLLRPTLRGGSYSASSPEPSSSSSSSSCREGSVVSDVDVDTDDDHDVSNDGGSGVIVSPSILAADWSDLRSALDGCILRASCPRIHLDVFDGVWLDSPSALTFGPQMVRALRDYCEKGRGGGGDEKGVGEEGVGAATRTPPTPTPSLKDAILDVHLCVDRPGRYVDVLSESGASRVIFQWEGVGRDVERAMDVVRSIVSRGMRAGISVDPSTDIEEVVPFLDAAAAAASLSPSYHPFTGKVMIDTVDVLAVEPGFGGQTFQPSALGKIRALKRWREKSGYGRDDVKIMVDGGMNGQTATVAIEAGADVIVAGTFLFRHESSSIRRGVEELLLSVEKAGGGGGGGGDCITE